MNELNNSKKKARKEVQQALKDLKTGPCRDCKMSFPYFVMDLDYIGPREKFSISKALEHVNDKNFQFIISQLQESEVVCSNCHRIRDFKRGTRGK